MATEPQVWKELLKALVEERDELELVIQAVQRRVEAGSIRDRVQKTNGATAPTTERTGPYANMSINEAARTFLASVKGSKTTREVCEALVAGGVVSHAKNFPATVYGSMLRAPDLKRVRKKWKLSVETSA